MGIGTGHSIENGDITGREMLISELPVQPSMSADDLQKRFDALGLFIKGKYNTLVADLENAFTAAGISNNLLALPPSGSEGPLPGNDEFATTVAGQLNYLLWLTTRSGGEGDGGTVLDTGVVTDEYLSNISSELKARFAAHISGSNYKHAVAHLPTGTTADKVALGNHTHSGYAATSHDHDASDIGTGTLAFGRLPTGTSATSVAKGDHVHAGAAITSGTVPIARLPTGTTTSTVALGSHIHDASAVTSGELNQARIPLLGINKISGLQGQLNIKQDLIDGAATSVVSNDLTAWRVLYSDGNGKIAASAYVDTTELNHLSGVTAPIQTQLDGKQAAGSYAAASHTHSIGNVTNLQSALDGKQAAGSYASASHLHTSLNSLRIAVGVVPGIDRVVNTYISNSSTPPTDVENGTVFIQYE